MDDGERGQATVEAALTLPVVLLGLLLIVQVAVVVRDALALAQAAREGARAAAVSARDDQARAAVLASAGPLDAHRIEIEIEPAQAQRTRGARVTVRLSYAERLRIPVISRVVSMDLPLRAQATMHLERDAPSSSPAPSPAPAPSPSAPP